MPKYAAYGTLLQIGDGATPEVFTTVAYVADVTGPNLSLATEDSTTHDSVDGWKEKIPTLLEAGAVGLDLRWDPQTATHSYTSGMVEDMKNRAVRNFQIVFPDVGTTTWKFPAVVSKWTPKAPVAGLLAVDAELTPTGKPTLE